MLGECPAPPKEPGMDEPLVPPLTREALDQLPTVQQALLEFWQALAALAADVATGSVHIHPDRVPARELHEWVVWHSHLLEVVFKATGKLDRQVWELLETPGPLQDTL